MKAPGVVSQDANVAMMAQSSEAKRSGAQFDSGNLKKVR